MSRKPSDLTLTPNLSEEGGTGPLRMRRPVYVDLLPPCNHACPASENIQAWLAEVEAGRADEAEIVLPSHRASHVLRRGIVATVSFARADQDQRGNSEEPVPDGCLGAELDQAIMTWRMGSSSMIFVHGIVALWCLQLRGDVSSEQQPFNADDLTNED